MLNVENFWDSKISGHNNALFSNTIIEALPEDSNKDNENISVENDDDTLTMIMVVVIFLCCNTLVCISTHKLW